MREFSDGIELGVNEDDYLNALKDYADGIVVSEGKSGRYVRHKASCNTLSYDLKAKNSPTPQRRRSAKILFRNDDELSTWLTAEGVDRADLPGEVVVRSVVE